MAKLEPEVSSLRDALERKTVEFQSANERLDHLLVSANQNSSVDSHQPMVVPESLTNPENSEKGHCAQSPKKIDSELPLLLQKKLDQKEQELAKVMSVD